MYGYKDTEIYCILGVYHTVLGVHNMHACMHVILSTGVLGVLEVLYSYNICTVLQYSLSHATFHLLLRPNLSVDTVCP